MSIAKHTTANLIGAAVPPLIIFATVPLYLRLIGEERYGVLAVIWALLAYFGFFDLGLGRATAQRMAKLDDRLVKERANLFWTALALTSLLGLTGGITLWLCTDYFLSHIITMKTTNLHEVSGAIIWLVVALPILLTSSVMNGALHGRQQFVVMNAIGIVGNSLNQIAPLLVAWLGYQGLEYLVPAALSGRFVTSLLLFQQAKKFVPLQGQAQLDFSQIKPLIVYGGWTSLISMLAPLLVTIDRLVIVALSGAKSVAYYTVPFSAVSYLMILSSSLSSALFPRLAVAKPQAAFDLSSQATQILTAVMTPVMILALSMVQPFLNLWVGADFAGHSAGISEIILLGLWTNCLAIPHYARLQAEGKLRGIVGVYIVEIPIYLAMLWFGLTKWGIIGAAIAWSLRIAMDTMLILWLAGALKQTLLRNLFSGVMVALAAAASLGRPVDSLERWGAVMLLAAITIFNGWRSIAYFARVQFLKQKSSA